MTMTISNISGNNDLVIQVHFIDPFRIAYIVYNKFSQLQNHLIEHDSDMKPAYAGREKKVGLHKAKSTIVG